MQKYSQGLLNDYTWVKKETAENDMSPNGYCSLEPEQVYLPQ